MRILHIAPEWGYWGDLHPDMLDEPSGRQIAGSETAMLRAVQQMAARGHDVACCARVVDLDRKSGKGFYLTGYGLARYRGLNHLPALLAGERWDVIIAWASAGPLRAWKKAGLLGDARIVLTTQCTAYSPTSGIDVADAHVFPSRWHADFMRRKGYVADGMPVHVVPNGVAVHHYDPRSRKGPRDPFAVYHASSPDRGLHHLLRAWPLVVEREPRATLTVCYEMAKYLAHALNDPALNADCRVRAEEVRDAVAAARALPSVRFLGAVDQRAVAALALRSGVLAYPCDPTHPTETFGSTLREAHVAGCEVLTTDVDAFAEVHHYATRIPLAEARSAEKFAAHVLEAIRCAAADAADPACVSSDETWHREAWRQYDWSAVGARWEEVLEAVMSEEAAHA